MMNKLPLKHLTKDTLKIYTANSLASKNIIVSNSLIEQASDSSIVFDVSELEMIEQFSVFIDGSDSYASFSIDEGVCTQGNWRRVGLSKYANFYYDVDDENQFLLNDEKRLQALIDHIIMVNL